MRMEHIVCIHNLVQYCGTFPDVRNISSGGGGGGHTLTDNLCTQRTMIHEDSCLNIQRGAYDAQHEDQPLAQTELCVYMNVVESDMYNNI